ncbi:hypothetical protein ACN4EK_05040 [Pantanalinema rosaneae CENA516]|uniref:hypothetical protein n=1 Tax=Pantanalinema rosaneae TaxID=1620701 RepID=UPI003D6F89AE
MLHLAQVQIAEKSGKAGVRLLAFQRSDYAWMTIQDEEFLPTEAASSWSNGLLVLVKLSASREVLEIRDAKAWVLDIVQSFLVSGVTPDFLREETERAEQWRRSLTLQSQELDRRALELEARREQIQQLEETLKREKKQLEQMAAEYKTKLNPSN